MSSLVRRVLALSRTRDPREISLLLGYSIRSTSAPALCSWLPRVVVYEWHADVWQRSIAVLHALAHALLAMHAGRRTELDAVALTQALRSGRRWRVR